MNRSHFIRKTDKNPDFKGFYKVFTVLKFTTKVLNFYVNNLINL
jgi:hypothetical protein